MLGFTASGLGLVIRGLCVTSNFCPTEPVVHSLLIYVQHETDEIDDLFDNFNTHDA